MNGRSSNGSRAGRPGILVLSHVIPVQRQSGQEQRIFYTLDALRRVFHVTFASVAEPERAAAIREGLGRVVDDFIPIEPAYRGPWHKAAALAYQAGTGLKRSNYQIGCVEFHPSRIEAALGGRKFDCVLLEYWHASDAMAVFRRRGIPCILDQHNVLWRAYEVELQRMRAPQAWKRRALERYRRRELESWSSFDGVIAINRAELEETRRAVQPSVTTFHTPMGTDLSQWAFGWKPVRPARVAYYGALTSWNNQLAALESHRRIMPRVWAQNPDAELWIVGSNPPENIRALAQSDSRIHVTGFVADPAEILRTASVVVCPWVGTYGFRSRLIEVMALGVPVVAANDAVYGMDLDHGSGILLAASTEELAAHAARLLADPAEASRLSVLARKIADERFSLDATYGRLTETLVEWLEFRKRPEAGSPRWGTTG